MPYSAIQTLKIILKTYFKKLAVNFFLVIIENALFLSYPIFAGFAVNSVLKGDAISALAYAIAVLIIWGIGAIRRMNDTRTFSRIYAKLAVSVILNDENRSQDVSITQARANLSREFVDFFEEHFPVFFTSAISIIGAAIALLFLSHMSGLPQ